MTNNLGYNNGKTDEAVLGQIAAGAHAGAVVWQVAAVADYEPFAAFYAEGIGNQQKRLVYFHFTDQKILLAETDAVTVISANPQTGFEPFIDSILRIIQDQGNRSAYLFDCISPLVADWYSDQMVGNFFAIVCAALRAANATACFSILRNQHSQYATDPITQTAHAVLDVCHFKGHLYVQPLKLEYETVSCRHRLHVWGHDGLHPVLDSHSAAAVLTSSRRDNLGLARHHLGVWSRTFVEAEALLRTARNDAGCDAKIQAMRDRILRMAVSRDERVLQLVHKYFSLEDLVFLGTRMLGTGLIGGKAADMLLARAALAQQDAQWHNILEAHDSFFIPSDVFYTFLVQNGVWPLRRQLLSAPGRRDIAKEAQRRIHNGTFPPHIMKRFSDMLDYFGETPLVVRSSSLLEDSFGNAFSGKYESVFCINQGPRAARIEELAAAIQTVYASAMDEDALDYRAAHGLLERDEQMAILVQRVAGAFHGSRYFPHLAAVGFSFNPYVWHEDIDSRAGVLRLVFGLGTRAVNRSDDDYTRLVALNAPLLRPDHHETDLPAPAQQWVDVLDLEEGRVVSAGFREIAPLTPTDILQIFASEDQELLRAARKHKLRRPFAFRLSFETLLAKTDFPEKMRVMLATLEESYGVPVDVELAVNFTASGDYRINLLQCRPMQVKGVNHPVLPKLEPTREQIVIETAGPVIGRSRFISIDYLLYIAPTRYSALPERDQYAVARLIGEFNRRIAAHDSRGNLMLVGPGRWGSTSPALGLPVSFAEINRAAAICEILALRDDLVTEVSLGTHFFNDLVEVDMLYMAVQHDDKRVILNTDFLENAPNRLIALLPGAAQYEHVIRLVETGADANERLFLRADTIKQHVCVCRL